MKIAQNQFTLIARFLFRAALYLSILYLFFLLAKGGHHLISSFSVPFGLSPLSSLVLSSLFITLLCCFGLLVIIHFFKSKDIE
jgi:hypothetical protein